MGGNIIDYLGDFRTIIADLATLKSLLNSTISTPGLRFMTTDIINFHLNTKLYLYEYMRLALELLPELIILQYNLQDIGQEGYVNLEICKGFYGLSQSGVVANKRITKHLSTFGYSPTPHNPGLCRHQTRPIAFTLFVDDSRVKYVVRQHVKHLVAALAALYPLNTDR